MNIDRDHRKGDRYCSGCDTTEQSKLSTCLICAVGIVHLELIDPATAEATCDRCGHTVHLELTAPSPTMFPGSGTVNVTVPPVRPDERNVRIDPRVLGQ